MNRYAPWLAVILSLPVAPVLAADGGATVTFEINDILQPDQVAEEESIAINHIPVGVLKLTADKPHDSVKVTVPAAKIYQYDLCGHTDLRAPDGSIVTHKIDAGGSFADVDGRVFGVSSWDELVFYLDDMSPAKILTPELSQTEKHSCPDSVAMN